MSHFTLGVVNVGGGECRGGECRTIFKTANNGSISRPNSWPKLPFPGNGKRNLKCQW